MKKIIGYPLFILSFAAWAVIVILPFFELTKVQIASFTTILLIAGEVFFWLSLVLLGKEFWTNIKAFFTRKKLINKEQ